MSRARRNGLQWASNVLRAAYDIIRADLGPDWFPLDAMGEWDEAGCGAFGCVFQTNLPGVVCKVTLDGSEAMFADLCIKRDLRFPGLPVWVGRVIRVEQPAPVWVMWRGDLGGESLDRLFYSRLRSVEKKISPFEQEYAYRETLRDMGYEDMQHLDAAQQCGLAVSSHVATSVLNGPPMTAVLRTLELSLDWAKANFKPEKRGIYWSYMDGSLKESGSEERAAIRLLAYNWHLQQLQRGKLVPKLAKSLQDLLRQDLMLCDCSADNIDGEVSVPTLRDCGFCLPLRRRWRMDWEESRADVFVWWNSDVRRKYIDAWQSWRG